MNDWTFSPLGAWLPLLLILGAAAMALAFALLMEAVVGSGPLPTGRYAHHRVGRRAPATRRR
jgi:hypothetical protein